MMKSFFTNEDKEDLKYTVMLITLKSCNKQLLTVFQKKLVMLGNGQA